jgi:hypothetical protein
MKSVTHSKPLAGECLCGTVKYTVADEFKYAMNCHCADCRRATGSAFKPFGGIEQEKLSLTHGMDKAMIFGEEDGNHDVHCGACGSLLFSVIADKEFVHVTLGTLVDAPGIRPTAHIFVAGKAPWYDITDELPQFPGHQ